MHRWLAAAPFAALLCVCGVVVLVGTDRPSSHARGQVIVPAPARVCTNGARSIAGAAPPDDERDSLRDGFPDAVRIARPEDRATFVCWLTYLAELQYYSPSPTAAPEIRDCAGLIRFAFRNALAVHNAARRRSMETWPARRRGETTVASRKEAAPSDGITSAGPDFGDLREFTYPDWVLGANLFRTRAGPLAAGDLTNGAFVQFADAASLLHYNTYFVSRDVHAARPGDLLFYNQPGQSETYHAMLFVGRSYFRPQGTDWVVYHTGDLNGRSGEIREVEVQVLMEHPDPRWRPLVANPRFLGVYRFELLR